MNVTEHAKSNMFQNEFQSHNVKYLLGFGEILNQPLPPYSQEAIDFLNAISMALLRDLEAKQYPDIISYAFWCRKANLIRLSEASQTGEGRIGRGLVFHVAPSNIPINFAFSYSFGLLAGNANIVRLPSKNFPQSGILARIFRNVLSNYPDIDKRTAWIQYPADPEITAYFSQKADARMLWGGDQTIMEIRQGKSNPKSIDLCFADRYSIGILDGKAILEASEQELETLAEKFYNDTWLMDQNACSSPQLLLWFQASTEAKTKFWNAVVSYAEKKYNLQPASAVDKYLQVCNDAIRYDCIDNMEHVGNILYRIHLKYIPKESTSLRGKCGYFYEYDIMGGNIREGLNSISSYVTEKYQTLTYFGINPQLLQDWVLKNNLRGIDRIVPFGKAMDINVIWDGYDIIKMLSRIVNME